MKTSNYADKFISLLNTRQHITVKKKLNVLLITSFPNRECGIATFSYDLLSQLNDSFSHSIHVSVCAIDHSNSVITYKSPVNFILESDNLSSFKNLKEYINRSKAFDIVLIQHEFGLFGHSYGEKLLFLMNGLNIPAITVFHTVLPNPNHKLLNMVRDICSYSSKIVVMTAHSKTTLHEDYKLSNDKIEIIPHGTHLISWKNQSQLKEIHALKGKTILSTFGLLSPGKNIEMAILSLPKILALFPNVVYLIIGKTHPEVKKKNGEKYRHFLMYIVEKSELKDKVIFINEFVSKEQLEDLLQLTDIYLFTSNDPNQAVSGTFSYAMACGCPIVATKIPHATHELQDAGILIDFNNSQQLAQQVIDLLANPLKCNTMQTKALQKSRPTVWQNVALSYINLLLSTTKTSSNSLIFNIPDFNIKHLKNLTTEKGMIQFSVAEFPDLTTGYTLDDNARALIASVGYFKMTNNHEIIPFIEIYFNFIERMQGDDGYFNNYLTIDGKLSTQNELEDLYDANGRAIWALGETMEQLTALDELYSIRTKQMIEKSLKHIQKMTAPRSISFALKGLTNYYKSLEDENVLKLISELCEKLSSFYDVHSSKNWRWFENGITYANAVIPEALILGFVITKNERYKTIAIESFDYLLSILFKGEYFQVISNKTWYYLDFHCDQYGEQPIDVAYTIIALDSFKKICNNISYDILKKEAFDWYLGKNQLNQIIYNPITGGCYDGIEEFEVNINQGAEATVTYLMARNCMEPTKVNYSQKHTEIDSEELVNQQIEH